MLTQRQLFLQHVAQTSPGPLMLEIEKAKGMYMYSPDGKKYLDLISGVSVSNLGHGHPHVIGAIEKQLSRYMHLMVYGELVQAPQVALAEKLTSLLPSELNSVYFVNSGSEAIEGAMKLAKRFTGRKKIIAMRGAYHGSTQGALSLMDSSVFTEAFQPLLPNIEFIHFNKEDDFEKIDRDTACVVCETIQGESGYITEVPGYLRKLREHCQQMGALLVLDEVQCGYGRTGKFFAFEHYGLTPDILVLAKGMGGGLPLGAFISRKEIMEKLTYDPILGHISTFGGHPVSCTASLATLEVLLEEKLVEQVAEKEMLFRELLKHPEIKSLNGKGLMLALGLNGASEVKKVSSALLEAGIFTDGFLHVPHCVRITPPLIISEEEIRFVCAEILKALDNL